MKKIFILLLVPIVLLGMVGCGNKDTKKEETNKDKYEEIKEEYSDYDFFDIETYDEETNGQTKYGKKEWITYATEDEFSFDGCGEMNLGKYNFKIENGIMIITDGNDNEYALEKIKDIKNSMIYYDGMSCTSATLVILTNEGKIYYHNLVGTDIFVPSSLEEKLKLVESDYIFDEIGVSKYMALGHRLGAHTQDGKSVTINYDYVSASASEPYDENIYDYIIRAGISTLIITLDGTMYFEENNYIVDEENNKIYVNYAMDADKYYIVDRQGYLYTLDDNGQTNIAKKYSTNKVVSIGKVKERGNKASTIIVLEDEEVIELYSVNDIRY